MRYVGYSIPVNFERCTEERYIDLLTDMRSGEGIDKVNAIELNMPMEYPQFLGGALLNLVKEFEYVSIHTTGLTTPDKSKDQIAFYHKAARILGAQALVVHPPMRQSLDWVFDEFGQIIKFENLDITNEYGSEANEVCEIVANRPNAEITLDLNHLLTKVDGDLTRLPALADEFHAVGMPDVGLYHLSGFISFDNILTKHATLSSVSRAQVAALLGCIRTNATVMLETHGPLNFETWREDDNLVKHLRRLVGTPS